MERKSKKIDDLLCATKNEINIEESMVQVDNILNMFNSTQNQYLQLKNKDDGAYTWFQDIGNWLFQFKHKIYNWLSEAERVSRRSARRNNQSSKSRSSHSPKKFFFFLEKEYQSQEN